MRALLVAGLLCAFPSRSRGDDHLPIVYLNHFFVTLDATTYAAVRKSPELGVLASTEERTTKTNFGEYSGFYLRGRHTFIELMQPMPPPDEQLPRDSGIGLSVEEAGGLSRVVARLRSAFGDAVKQEPHTRNIDGHEIPWYTAAGLFRDTRMPLVTWVQEIDPSYLAKRHPGVSIAQPLAREQYLSWDFRPDRQLDDVVGLTVGLSEGDARELAAQLSSLGWSVHKGQPIVATGPGCTITIAVSATRLGIREAELRLRRASPKRKISIGSMVLLLDGRRAWLRF
jgi:hypothetical protein